VRVALLEGTQELGQIIRQQQLIPAAGRARQKLTTRDKSLAKTYPSPSALRNRLLPRPMAPCRMAATARRLRVKKAELAKRIHH
jgi:hypothetical protein